jgi:hypothetical protein
MDCKGEYGQHDLISYRGMIIFDDLLAWMPLSWREIVGTLDFREREMRTKVTEHGVPIPKQWLEAIDEVEVRKEQNITLVLPITASDLILELGKHPIVGDAVDASSDHDRYLYGR